MYGAIGTIQSDTMSGVQEIWDYKALLNETITAAGSLFKIKIEKELEVDLENESTYMNIYPLG